jgi:O-antigen/teichoic acid export membrane protein
VDIDLIVDWLKKELAAGKELIVYGILRVGGETSAFLIPIILATQFSPDILGAYSLGMMIVYFTNTVLITSSGRPAVIHAGEEIRQSNKINRTMTARLVIIGLAVAVFFLFLAVLPHPVMRFTGLTRLESYLLLPVLIGLSITSFISTLFFALGRRVAASVYLCVTAGCSIAYLILIHLLAQLTLTNVLLMFFIAPISASILMLFWIDRSKVLPLSYDRDALIRLAHFTKWMIMGGAAVYLLKWGDNIILRLFVSMDEIGVYNLGYQFFKGTIMGIEFVKFYFLPFIAVHIADPEKIAYYLNVKRAKLVILGLLLLLAIFMIMPSLVGFLYKDHYRDAALVCRLLLLGSAFYLCSGFYDPVLETLGKYKVVQAMLVGTVCFNLTLDYVLISRMGFLGAAVATTISYVLFSVVKAIYFRRVTGRW